MNGRTGDGADEGAEPGTVDLEPFRGTAGKRLVQWEYDPNDLVKVLQHKIT
jgi:hypothetical protein